MPTGHEWSFLRFVCLSSSFPLQVNDELKPSLRQSDFLVHMVLTGYSRNYWNWPRNLNCLPPPVAPGRVDYLGQSRDAAQRYPDIDVRGQRQAHVSRLCLYAADRKTFAQLCRGQPDLHAKPAVNQSGGLQLISGC